MLNRDIVKAVIVTSELTGSTISEAGIEAMVEHLSGYPVEVVMRALHRCQIELRGGLTLGAVMDRLDDGHLGPETAWALVAGIGEDDSVVWTDEIAASYGLVRGLDDRVAGRMAFLEDYRKRLSVARQEHKSPHWWASLGWNRAGHGAAIRDAVERGRLGEAEARGLLPAHEGLRPEMLSEGSQAAAGVVKMLSQRLAVDTKERGRRLDVFRQEIQQERPGA